MPATLRQLNRRFPNKRAFITGGGSGLGLEMARALAREGWWIGLFDVDSERLARAEGELSSNGAHVLAYPGDVTRFEELVVAVNSFVDVAGGLDVMINNAGVACAGSLLETRLEDWRWIVDINLLGVVNGCRAGIPHLQHSGHGILLNIASAAAFVAAPFMSSYNATKAAVLALSESLAGELSNSGVQVSVAMPGFMQTDLLLTARGPQRERDTADQLMKSSRYTASMGAFDILERASKYELHIVVPGAMRHVWRIKRWFPSFFVRQFPRIRDWVRNDSAAE
jgi:NAD(P)-dependent dehydrogenase (short-subunit alcohol dehydrogenase family)